MDHCELETQVIGKGFNLVSSGKNTPIHAQLQPEQRAIWFKPQKKKIPVLLAKTGGGKSR